MENSGLMNSRYILPLLPIYVFFCGCIGGDDGRLATAPVEVTVLYKGKAVPSAVVTFMIAGSGAVAGQSPAFGTTNANGKAKLQTFKANDGAVLGNHTVMIAKQEFADQKEAASQDSAEYNPGASPLPVVKHLLPVKYSLPGSSTLTAEVVKGKTNSFSFDLKD